MTEVLKTGTRALGAVRSLAVATFVLATLAMTTLAASPASAQPGATTSTLPVDNREFGEIIPKPNAGKAPETPGDPGGWLQVSLFFLICAVVLLIVGIVWWQSKKARDQRAAAGLDPVSVARARGEGVRRTN